MRKWLLKIVEKIHIWLIPKGEVKSNSLQMIPIFKCVPFRSGMDEDNVKRVLVNKMTSSLIQYIEFNKEEQDTGVTLLTARLDVIKREKK